MGITLYHCWGARSFRPLWLLEEMTLPHTLEMLPFPPRHLAPQYLALNPLGTVPLLLDGATRMTESAAICQYLATRYGPTTCAVSAEEPDYGAFLNFLHFGEATLTFPQTLVLRYSQFEPEHRRNPQVADDYARWFLARLRTVAARLETMRYMCADRFTAADISVGYALLLARYSGLDSYLPPAVQEYWDRLQQREGYQRARAREDAMADAGGLARMTVPQKFELAPKA